MKLLFIFGTRPEAIKLAPLIQLCRSASDIQPIICVTAQHRSLLDQMLKLFEITADIDLDLMTPNQDLLDLSGRMLIRFRELFDTSKPDVVVVQGDTTSAFLAGFAAFYRQIPVAHVEAGLRSHQPYNPFPEEINRALLDRLCTWHFAPTQHSKENLLKEGIHPKNIHVTGNTVVDALHWMQKRLEKPEAKEKQIKFLMASCGYTPDPNRKLILVTTHRRESFGAELEANCLAVKELLQKNKNVDVVFPVHPNPNVRHAVEKTFEQEKNLYLTPPLDYEPFIFLLMRASLILTDSGGVQEEAPSFGVPVVVMRRTTERPELIESGFGKLVGTSTDSIVAAAQSYLKQGDKIVGDNPFGDGKSAGRILELLRRDVVR